MLVFFLFEFLLSVTLMSTQAPWTLPSSWTICPTSHHSLMSCWWKIWVWKSVRERMCWWWETQALARHLCWGSSTASGRRTAVSVHQQNVVEVCFVYFSRRSGARHLSPQALSRWPHASDPEEPSSCLRNRIWLTGRCVSRSLFSKCALGLFKWEEIEFCLFYGLTWERWSLTGGVMCHQVIYPLKNIYPQSGITLHYSVMQIITTNSPVVKSVCFGLLRPSSLEMYNNVFYSLIVKIFFRMWSLSSRASGWWANCTVSGTGRSGKLFFL